MKWFRNIPHEKYFLILTVLFGVEFAAAAEHAPGEPFFLALHDEWLDEIAPRPVAPLRL